MTSEQFQQGRIDFTQVCVIRDSASNVLPPEWRVIIPEYGLIYGILVWVGNSYRFRPGSFRLDVHAIDTISLREITQACVELTDTTALLLTNGYFPGKGSTS